MNTMSVVAVPTEVPYKTYLKDEHLIFITEMLVLGQFRFAFGSVNPLVSAMVADGVSEMTAESVRELLREPLRDSRFRARFNEHFKTHPLGIIRESGWPWLSELLVWEN